MSLRDALVKTQDQPKKTTGTLRRASSAILRPTGEGEKALRVAARRDLDSLKKAEGRVGFLIDATASRMSGWEEAQKIQATMFKKTADMGDLSFRLVHFGGDKLVVEEWCENSDEVAQQMRPVSCCCGHTQIIRGLKAFLSDKRKPNSIILVGDSFEEEIEVLKKVAEELAKERIKVFAFLDGFSITATEAFTLLADKTGGAFAHFGKDMPLDDLCEGVALMSLGGVTALSRLQNGKARQLLAKTLQLTA